MSGVLALVGGGEWSDGCSFDAELLTASGSTEVLVLQTAAAFENPKRCIEQATRWFDDMGATVRALPVYSRSDAGDPSHADAVRAARLIYVAGG